MPAGAPSRSQFAIEKSVGGLYLIVENAIRSYGIDKATQDKIFQDTPAIAIFRAFHNLQWPHNLRSSSGFIRSKIKPTDRDDELPASLSTLESHVSEFVNGWNLNEEAHAVVLHEVSLDVDILAWLKDLNNRLDVQHSPSKQIIDIVRQMRSPQAPHHQSQHHQQPLQQQQQPPQQHQQPPRQHQQPPQQQQQQVESQQHQLQQQLQAQVVQMQLQQQQQRQSLVPQQPQHLQQFQQHQHQLDQQPQLASVLMHSPPTRVDTLASIPAPNSLGLLDQLIAEKCRSLQLPPDVVRALRNDNDVHLVVSALRNVEWALVNVSNASGVIRQRLRQHSRNESGYSLDEAFEHIGEFIEAWSLSERVERAFKWELALQVELLAFLDNLNGKLGNVSQKEHERTILSLIREQAPESAGKPAHSQRESQRDDCRRTSSPRHQGRRERSPCGESLSRNKVPRADNNNPNTLTAASRGAYADYNVNTPTDASRAARPLRHGPPPRAENVRAPNHTPSTHLETRDDVLSKPLPKSSPPHRVPPTNSTASAASSPKRYNSTPGSARQTSSPPRLSNPPYAPRQNTCGSRQARNDRAPLDSAAALDERVRAFTREHGLDQKAARALLSMPALQARECITDPMWVRNRPANPSAYVSKFDTKIQRSNMRGESLQDIQQHISEFVIGWNLDAKAEQCLKEDLSLSVNLVQWLERTNGELGKAKQDPSLRCVQLIRETQQGKKDAASSSQSRAVPEKSEAELLREYKMLEDKLKEIQKNKNNNNGRQNLDRRPLQQQQRRR